MTDAATEPQSGAAGRWAVRVEGVTHSYDVAPVLRDVSLEVESGRIVALLGPSGCGKTTLLRVVAGLERPELGRVLVGDRILMAPGTFVPPEKRRVGMVFQDWALFPHMTVGRNVGFGLSRSERRSGRVGEALAMVDLDGLGGRMPSTLSGGQQQRVALARALAPRPSVLLLDEPFSSLDPGLRTQVRTDVHGLLTELGVTTIFVTHDQEEAFVLGDEVAVMHDGVVEQQAAPAELYARPASRWVADFVGDANLVAGVADGRRAATPVGEVPLADRHQGPVEVLLRPEELRVREGEHGFVELVEFRGHDTVYRVRLDNGSGVRVRAGSAPRHGRGDRVELRYLGLPTVAYPVRPKGGRSPDPPAESVSVGGV